MEYEPPSVPDDQPFPADEPPPGAPPEVPPFQDPPEQHPPGDDPIRFPPENDPPAMPPEPKKVRGFVVSERDIAQHEGADPERD